MNEEVGDYGKPEPEFDISAADVNVTKDGQNRRKKNMVSGVDDSVSFTSENNKKGKQSVVKSDDSALRQ